MSVIPRKKEKPKGGRRVIHNLTILPRKEGSSSTYIRLDGVIAVPNSLVDHYTIDELFTFLKSRKLVGEASEVNLEFSKRQS
jgi:hypothetical protein